ncbi:hypothetical protein [Photobacterium aquimaris]|uniref:Uncharacterized protein n=1 Tax=Photobacterium aquimaris TaxID=512643 RepID=A0A2T3I0P5_9GAMM|nr:hypothetical protein [Photobacterium aquimaris]OBU25663.1 hypothetical protein AYY21_08760 [Photobacterium aquimaris]PQJ37041.1 hypothetical protein BTN98_18035 [Photobacterium aquimaris]PSU10104.1 hypothetical protein C0W81_05100 [Photobacterium aquimaris]
MTILRTTLYALLLSTLAISGYANAVYYPDKKDYSGVMNTSPTYSDKIIVPRQEYLTENGIIPTMPSLQYVAGTVQAERFIDKTTSDIDVKPYTQDRLLYQVYIPLDKMQGTPTNFALTLKGNQKFARQLMMNFSSTAWRDNSGKTNQQKSMFGYRFDGLDIYGTLTDEKTPLDDSVWEKYDSDKEFINSKLGFQTRILNFVKNDNGIPQEDVMFNGVDRALVRLRPTIHSFMPAGSNSSSNDQGNYSSSTAPYFSVSANQREKINAPILFSGRFLLKNKLNRKGHNMSELGFTNKTPKYLRILFYMRGGVRYWNPNASVSLKNSHNVKMNRNIAQECAIIDKDNPTVEQYIPENIRDSIMFDNHFNFTSILSLTKKSDDKYIHWSACESKRTEIYPLTYEIFVN